MIQSYESIQKNAIKLKNRPLSCAQTQFRSQFMIMFISAFDNIGVTFYRILEVILDFIRQNFDITYYLDENGQVNDPTKQYLFLDYIYKK